MPKSVEVEFSGYVTRNDIKCRDGRTIKQGAFKHCDREAVPLVWQHLHNDPGNVIGKIYLEDRPDGVYGYGTLNHTEKANNARELLRHGDIDHMSIYATNVVERGGNVMHGDIKEVSLVISAANPGAVIEHVSIKHSDGSFDDLEDEVVIHSFGVIDDFDCSGTFIDIDDGSGTGEVIAHADEDDEDGDEDGDETIQEIFDTLSEKQKNAVYAIVGAAVADAGGEVKQSDISDNNEGGNDPMKTNAFEQYGVDKTKGGVISHSDLVKLSKDVFEDCRNNKTNFHDSVIAHAAEYGIDDIEILFPDAKAVTDRPEFIKRRTEWVATVLNGTKHSPFTRIKTVFADITADEARARGYLKGNKKIEEVFPVMKRVTTPQTIYKKQKLDRDDILDITDFDVVAWLMGEMRIMLEEELARAVLIGDGRLVTSDDKISETNIRPIWTDDDFYAPKMQIASDDYSYTELEDTFLRARNVYEGAGSPVAYMSPDTVTEFLIQRDNEGRRMYKTVGELATALRVSAIHEVPLFNGLTRTEKGKTYALDAIVVNLGDYTIGTDRGGEITSFNDFDIDYNQYKYLLETRVSGALTAYHSAVIIEHEVTTATTPTTPTTPPSGGVETQSYSARSSKA